MVDYMNIGNLTDVLCKLNVGFLKAVHQIYNICSQYFDNGQNIGMYEFIFP